MRLKELKVTITCLLPEVILGFSQKSPVKNRLGKKHSTKHLVGSRKMVDRRDFFYTTTSIISTTTLITSNPSLSSAAIPNSLPAAIGGGNAADVSWPLGKVAFSLLPLAGTSTRRATVEECIVPDTIWTHDQVRSVTLFDFLKELDRASISLWKRELIHIFSHLLDSGMFHVRLMSLHHIELSIIILSIITDFLRIFT